MLDPSRRKEIRAKQEARKAFDPQKEERLRLYANQNIGDATYAFANVPLMNSITANQFDAKSLPYQDILDGVNLKGIGLKNFSVHDGNIVDKVFSARAKAYNNDKSGGELAVIRKMKEWGDQNNPAVSTFVQTGILVPGVTKDALLEAYDYGLRSDAKKMQTKPKGFFKSLIKGNIGAIAGLALAPFTGGASIAAGVAAQNIAEGDNPFTRIGKGEIPFTSVEAEITKDLIQGTKKGLSRNKGFTDPSFLSNVGEATSITAPIGSALYNRQISGNINGSNLAMPPRREYKQPTYAIDTLRNNLGNNTMQLANFSLQPDPVITDLNVLFPNPYYRRGVTSTPGDPTGNAPPLENITRLFEFPGMIDPELGEDIVKRALYLGELVNPYLKAGGTPGSVAEAEKNRSESQEKQEKKLNLRDVLNPFLAALTPQQQQTLNMQPIRGSYNYRFEPVQFGANPLGVQSQIAQQALQELKPISDFEIEDIIRQVQRG